LKRIEKQTADLERIRGERHAANQLAAAFKDDKIRLLGQKSALLKEVEELKKRIVEDLESRLTPAKAETEKLEKELANLKNGGNGK
jgi:DNA repair exonuclease SbcCD ATPase subunit